MGSRGASDRVRDPATAIAPPQATPSALRFRLVDNRRCSLRDIGNVKGCREAFLICYRTIPLPRPQFFVQLSWHGVSRAAFQK